MEKGIEIKIKIKIKCLVGKVVLKDINEQSKKLIDIFRVLVLIKLID